MKLETEIFETEGKQNVNAVIDIVSAAAANFSIDTVIVFAAAADKVLRLRKTVTQNVSVIAVTFPAGMVAHSEGSELVYIGMPSSEDRAALRKEGIQLVQGVMPFRALGEISPVPDVLRRTFALFGGGTELCVQAVLMASDAGHLREGDRCLVMSADTALIMRAGNAFRFLRDTSRVVIEHILCKPASYQISRKFATPVESPLEYVETIEAELPLAIESEGSPAEKDEKAEEG
jgi:hypothetical protein